MERLLTAKAWKLFVAVVVTPFLLIIIFEVSKNFYYIWKTGESGPVEEFGWHTIMMILWLILILSLPFLWQYQVGTRLTRKLARGRGYFDRKFRFAFFGPVAVLVLYVVASIIQEADADGLSVSESRVRNILALLFLITYLIGFFFRYRQMGRTLHWVDEASNRPPRGNALNLLLSLFWWVGIWFLQPRVRAVWAELQERSVEEHFIGE